MRLVINGSRRDELVIAEAFDIPGSTEKFAVHRSLGADVIWKGEWSATHVETSLRIAAGETIDAAIKEARRVWTSKTPEEIASALFAARQVARTRKQSPREAH